MTDPFERLGDVLPGLEAGVEAMVVAARAWLAA